MNPELIGKKGKCLIGLVVSLGADLHLPVVGQSRYRNGQRNQESE
jgi:hypothetical protein